MAGPPQAKLSTAAQREQRQQDAYSLRLRGFGDEMIASVLGVPKQVVWRDLETLRRRMRVIAEELDPFDFVAETVAFFQKIRAECMIVAAEDPDNAVRLQALRNAADAHTRLVAFMQELGLVPKELGALTVRERGHDRAERPSAPGDVLECYETAFGTYSPEERQRIVGLDTSYPRLPSAESPGLPGARAPDEGAGGRVLPPGESGGVAGE